ncbi:MAG: gamma-glutamylcyclotransferase [Candidatus Geothermarchaeales archaeon]
MGHVLSCVPLVRGRAQRSLLFVYGTLKGGEKNYPLLLEKGAKYLGHARTLEKYSLYRVEGPLYSYPAMLEAGRHYEVHGEIYEVPKLSIIDRLEPQLKLHYRKVIDVKCENRTMRAWTYFFEPENLVKLRGIGRAVELLRGVWSSQSEPD